MQTYNEYAPTGFDNKGAFLQDQQAWLVVPVIQTRDSGALDESNFSSALAALGGESETVEVRRFGHWGPGWFEIIIVNPESPAAKEAESIENALADYPVLDESDFSEREWNRAAEYWAQCSISERVYYCSRYGASIFAARRDEIPEDADGEIMMALAE